MIWPRHRNSRGTPGPPKAMLDGSHVAITGLIGSLTNRSAMTQTLYGFGPTKGNDARLETYVSFFTGRGWENGPGPVYHRCP